MATFRILKIDLVIYNRAKNAMCVDFFPFRHLSNIRKALSTGEPDHIACLESPKNQTYRTYVRNKKVHIHPSSALYRATTLPEYLIYHETTSTTLTFMRTVSVCEGTWLPKISSV